MWVSTKACAEGVLNVRRLFAVSVLFLVLLCVGLVSGLEVVVVNKKCIVVDELYGLTICGCGGVAYSLPGLHSDRIVVVASGCSYCDFVMAVVHELVHAVLDVYDEYRTQYLTLYIMYSYLGEEARTCALSIALYWYKYYILDTLSYLKRCIRSCDHWDNYFWYWCGCIAHCIEVAARKQLPCGPYCTAAVDFLEDLAHGREPDWLQKIRLELKRYLPIIKHYLERALEMWRRVS